MRELARYFVAALKAELDDQPRGARSRTARLAQVPTSLLTDITKGRKYGSEETRRAIVAALGWDYEEFLKYGQCLEEGREYTTPEPARPAYEPGRYVTIPLARSVRRTFEGRETVFTPLPEPHTPPLLVPGVMLPESRERRNLAAFRVTTRNMEPGLPAGSLAVVDPALREPCDNKIFLLAAETGDYQINRLRQAERRLFAVSDNPEFPPELIEPGGEGLIVGQVVLAWHFYV